MRFVPLKTVADIQLGKMLSPKAKTGSAPVPYLRNQDVQWGRIAVRDLARMDFSTREREKFELRAGDLLVCEGGEPGRCAVWNGELVGCYYQKALHRVRPVQGVADSEYLSLWIRHMALTGAFQDQNAKTTIAHLPLVRFAQMPVPAVSVDEQKRLAARLKAQLAAVEEVRQVAQVQRTETVGLLSAFYRECFSGIVPVAVTTEFESSPVGWRWTKLTDVARLESGHTPSRSRPDWWGGDISWMSLTEIRALDGRWVDATQIKTNPSGIANSAARVLPRGTVCFSRTASVGFVAIMGQPMATSQDFANWVCGDALDPEFLMHALIRSRTELRALATGATHKTIYMPTLQSFHVCLPDRRTQERIVARLKGQLASVELMQKAASAQLEEIERLPSRLLAQAFDQKGEARP